ncbi:iron chelate uptake ABC transporter family permease subunit [Nakamurella sp. YIM 132087]|uniref:Iron chelate uptake ABC transporter family permease subunit n=1 Tax=Nakamurella alba TaxID=2665158 RepID=A0A7K1FKU4_9ACTN|nr:iron ABC transporter permease [Nakamurella alba]MTD14716.1 iron chelate uptake ABC transporter family permease subunit [Nakamurella alba]
MLTSPVRQGDHLPDARDDRPSHGRRGVLVAVSLLAAVVVVFAAGLALGSNPTSLGEVWRVIWHPDGSEAAVLVRDSRFPRTVLGLLVGACIGVAGGLMQGHTRNPLADPGLFGVSAGAGFAVVIGIHALHVTAALPIMVFAMIGALVAAVAVFGIATAGSAPASPVPMALAGTAVTALLVALTTFVVLNDRSTLDVYRRWVVGSLSGRDLGIAAAVLPVAVLGMLLAMWNAKALNNLALGDDVARGLGENVVLARIVGIGAITLLAGGATAAAGPLAFLGLVAPHLARALVGVDHRRMLPVAALVGALVLVAADVLGRVLGEANNEVQVGIVLAVVCGPFFVHIARRRSLVAL